MAKRKQPTLKVRISYSPAPDYRERLKKILSLLLRPSSDYVKENPKKTEDTEERR